MTKDNSKQRPKFSAQIIAERFQVAAEWADEAFLFARKLDWLGDAQKHLEGSEERELALVRDRVDLEFNFFFRKLSSIRRVSAEHTRCADLLVDQIGELNGDGSAALHLLRRYHALSGDEAEKDGEVIPDTFPDAFAWEIYLRVSGLAELAEEFPKHIRHSARLMHGWPMIVSRHLDGRREFERLADLLELGADYPLAAGARKRRGTDSPMLRYLEPVVWRLHVLRNVLIETEKTRGHEDFKGRLYPFWWDYPEEPPTPEVVGILKLVPVLPPLTRKTAREWSREVIVPIILAGDAGTAETCKTPALRNIWQHRSVKSRATFRSRLHSAVTDTLERFGRAE